MELGELIDNAPETLSRIARLWSVSSNYEYPSPATVFIDLIGYTDRPGDATAFIRQLLESEGR